MFAIFLENNHSKEIFATSSGGTLGNFGRKIGISKLKDLIVLLNHIEQGVTDIKASLWELGMACRIKAITSSLFFKNTHLLEKKGCPKFLDPYALDDTSM